MDNEIKRKKLSKEERHQIFEKYGGRCAYCGCELRESAFQVDHLVPFAFRDKFSEAGFDVDDFKNYMPACASCNHYKSTLTLEKFRKAIERWTEVLYRDNTTYRNAVRFGQVLPLPHKVTFYFEKVDPEWRQNKMI